MVAVPAVYARGGHGVERGGSGHHGGFRMPGLEARAERGTEAGGESGAEGSGARRHHGDNASLKAAAEEEDKLLAQKLKSICRGC
jgi:hypothetical protein